MLCGCLTANQAMEKALALPPIKALYETFGMRMSYVSSLQKLMLVSPYTLCRWLNI